MCQKVCGIHYEIIHFLRPGASLDAICNEVHPGAEHMHNGGRVDEYLHSMSLHQLIKLSLFVCIPLSGFSRAAG